MIYPNCMSAIFSKIHLNVLQKKNNQNLVLLVAVDVRTCHVAM